MKHKSIIFVSLFLITLLGSACQTQKPNYPPKRKKNRKCKECPKFSFTPLKQTQTVDFSAFTA